MMSNDKTPYTSRIEEACVMFVEPSETKDDTSCRLSLVTSAKIRKAYEELDEIYCDQ